MIRPLALLCMMLAGCAAAPVTMESLAGTRWVATGFAGPRAPTLHFAPDARVSGSGGCNRYFGTAEFTPEALRFGKLGSTRMACPGTSMQDETRFFHALSAVRAARVEDDALLLLDESGGVVLRLTRAQ